jgi:hypothetical protein
MWPLAMTKLSAYALYLMCALYVFLSVYAMLGAWRQKEGRQRTRLIWLLMLPIALFVTLWFSGIWIWTIFWWGFVFGDAGPYEQYGKFLSAIVAIVIATAVFVRLALGRINRRYLLVTFWTIVASSVLFVAVLTHEFTHRIYGWSARSAAENYLSSHRRMDPERPMQIVEVPTDKAGDLDSRVRTFVLYYEDRPQVRVNVAPYGIFWWTYGGSSNARDELEKYKKFNAD